MRHTSSRYPYKPDGFPEVCLFNLLQVINTFNDYDDDDDDDDDDDKEEED